MLRKLKFKVKTWFSFRSASFRSAKRKLLSSEDLTEAEREILSRVCLQLHEHDGMYVAGDPFHYLSVGLSAVRCIRKALSADSSHKVASILDFPCGHGRVMRFLRAMYPKAEITAGEIDGTALEFCSQTFSSSPILSTKRFADLYCPQKYDLIWCGSLITHIDRQDAIDLLRFFYDHLSEDGVCVFTTHGQYSIEVMLNGTYGLDQDAQKKVVMELQTTGYGYTDYPGQSDYGISITSHEQILELARQVGQWSEIMFLPQGWDNHQDVYAFIKHLPNN